MPPDPKCQVFTGARMGLVRGWVGHVIPRQGVIGFAKSFLKLENQGWRSETDGRTDGHGIFLSYSYSTLLL
jgi:hypothetical protein